MLPVEEGDHVEAAAEGEGGAHPGLHAPHVEDRQGAGYRGVEIGNIGVHRRVEFMGG